MISPCMESNPKFFHTLCGKSTVMRSFGFMITRSARIVIFLHFVPTVSFELKQMITVQAVGQILTKKWQPYSVNLFLVCMSIKKHHLVCFSPILIYCNFHGGWHFYNSFVQQENCHFYIYFILTCTLSISSFRTKICIGLSLQKLCETPGISICLCAWERVYLGRKHYREPLTNKRWETKGRTERRKSITGEKKHQYCVHLEEVSEKERKTEPLERGRELRWVREGGLRIKRGSLNEIIWKKSKAMREAFRETDKGKSGRLSTNWAGEKKKSSLVSAVNSAQTSSILLSAWI